MAAPVLAAVKKLMADGTYTAILKKWGIERRGDHQPPDQRGDQLTPDSVSAPAQLPLATWGRRAYALAIDLGIVVVGEAIAYRASSRSPGCTASAASSFKSRCWPSRCSLRQQAIVRQAAIGQTIGKTVAKISLVDDADGLSPTEGTCRAGCWAT